MRRCRLLAAAVVWAIAAPVGCDSGADRAPDSLALPLPDSIDLTAEASAPPGAATMLQDTMVALGTPSVTDTNAVAPTAAELVELSSGMVVPVKGVRAEEIADTFLEPRGSRVHQATDILAPRGTPVLSATDGRVVKLFTSVAGGLMIYSADRTGRFILLYSHLDGYAPGLTEGMQLRAGQQIGVVGTTGNASSSTPHLHFGIARVRDVSQWWSGTPVDPLPLLRHR